MRGRVLSVVAGLSAALAVPAACSSFDAEPAAADDASVDAPNAAPDAAGADASDASVARRCRPGAPFGAPSPLPGVNGADDDEDAVLTDDELTVFFTVARGGFESMFQASRAKPTDPFGVPIPVLSTFGDHQARPVLSADAKTLVFGAVSPPNGLGSYDLAFATRSDPQATFGSPGLIAGVSSPVLDGDPWLTRGGALWFASNRLADAGAPSFDLFRAGVLADGGFDVPRLVDVTGTHTELKPVTTADESYLFFSSQRTGSDDIWVAAREDGGTYATPTKVEELDTPAFERPSWISADGCLLVFASDRDGGAGGQDLYVARRAP